MPLSFVLRAAIWYTRALGGEGRGVLFCVQLFGSRMLPALSAVEFCSTCSYLALARFRHGALRRFILRPAVLPTRALALSAVDLFLGTAIWLTRALGTECCRVLVYVQLSGSRTL